MKNNRSLKYLLLRSQWPYWVGGIILGLLNIILAIVHKPWGTTGMMASWGFHLWSSLYGYSAVCDTYFAEIGFENLYDHPVFDETVVLNIGFVAGVLIAVLLSGRFRIKKIKSARQVILGITGGILMGYGARLALGCNVGAMIGGIASQSLHGWVFSFFLFFGSLAGYIVIKFFFIKT